MRQDVLLGPEIDMLSHDHGSVTMITITRPLMHLCIYIYMQTDTGTRICVSVHIYIYIYTDYIYIYIYMHSYIHNECINLSAYVH